MSDEWADPDKPSPPEGAGQPPVPPPTDSPAPAQPPASGYGPPPSGPPAGYGPPPPGYGPAPDYGTPPSGGYGAPPPYGPAPGYGALPTYGSPPAYGPPAGGWAAPGAPGDNPYAVPYGAAPSPGRSRRPLIIAIAVAVIAVLAIGSVAIGMSHGTSSSSTSTAPQLVIPGTSSAPSPASPFQSTQPGTPLAPGCGAISSAPLAPTGSTTTGPLDEYLLSPAEACATGMDLIDGGRGIGVDDATLDWCGRSYPSDQLRSGRVQVEYNGSDLFVSNEFVKYNAGGAATAYTEIQAAVQSCQPSFTVSGQTTNQIQVAPHSAAMVDDQLTVTAFEAGQLPLWTAVVYQFDGNYFSGVYVSGGTRASVLQGAEQLGASAATHLREAVAGKAGTGGGVVGSEPPESSSSPLGGGGAQT